MNKSSNSRLKKFKADNRKDIVTILYKDGCVSRLELTKRLKLSKASISLLVAEMIEQGLVVERGLSIEKKTGSGPRERLLALSGDYAGVLGISIERDYVSIGLCNLQNKTIQSTFRKTSEFSTNKAAFLDEIAQMAIALLPLTDTKLPPPILLGCAITIIGTVDQQSGISINSFGLLPKNTPLSGYFADKLNMPVWVENNVRALAMANYNYHSSAKEESCVFLKHGQGLGGAIIIDSQLLMGSTNEAGEVGHTVVAGNDAPCGCGKNGCLETLVSEEAILKSIPLDKYPVLSGLCDGDRRNLDIEKALEAIDAGEKAVLDHFKVALHYLAQTIANLYILVNPNVFILYGVIFQNRQIVDLLYGYLRQIMKGDAILATLKISRLESRKNYYGATDLVLRKYFESGAF